MSAAPRCTLCGGNAGRLNARGDHELCAALQRLGIGTPNLGERCETCDGSGTTGRGGVPLDFEIGPCAIRRSIEAQFPPCVDCDGKGYVVPDEDPPEPLEPVFGDCHYCGAVFEGTGDDCGGCRLTGEDLERYARDRAVRP